MGILELHARNRIRLLVSRKFLWIPAGPIEHFFRENVADFFATSFQRPHEHLSLTNVMLSEASRALLVARMQALVDEFVQAHARDTAAAFHDGARPASCWPPANGNRPSCASYAAENRTIRAPQRFNTFTAGIG